MNPAKVTRFLVLASMTMFAIVLIVVMQSKFDGADQRAAMTIVQTTPSKAGRTIVDVLDAKHPGKPPVWSVNTESACYQYERVRAAVYPTPGADPVIYDFLVDINGPSIHPGNPASEEIMKSLSEMPPALPPASASATAAASAATPAPTTSAAAP